MSAMLISEETSRQMFGSLTTQLWTVLLKFYMKMELCLNSLMLALAKASQCWASYLENVAS